MKRGIFFIFTILLLTGCGKNQKIMTCTKALEENNLKLDLKYTIEYTGDYVDELQSVEKVTTSDTATIEQYKKLIEQSYEPYKDVKYYEYEIKVSGDTLTSTVSIDYAKIDINKLLEIDSSNSQFIKNGKVKVEDMESLYKSIGASCNKNS